MTQACKNGLKMIEMWLEASTKQRLLGPVKYETHCGKHGTYVEADHNGKCMACLCEQDAALKEQKLQHQKLGRMKHAGIGKRYHAASFDNYEVEQRQVVEQLKNYQFDRNIVLIGKTGRGKTHLAMALINGVIMQKSCFFVKFYALAKIQIQHPDWYQEMLNCDFLVIDEFGVNDSDYKSVIAYEIYDYRYENELPTMMISNLNAEELKDRISDALYSRIKSNCLSLVLGGRDLRLEETA